MSVQVREWLLLAVVFAGAVWFVWTRIAADLPEDIFVRSRERLNAKKDDDGRLRDHR